MNLIYRKLYIKFFNTASILIIFGTFINSVFSTTIIAPPHLGALSNASDLVITAKMKEMMNYSEDGKIFTKFKFEVVEHIKGRLVTTDVFFLKNNGYIDQEYEFKILGDIQFEANKIYLLFLDEDHGIIRPQMLSYGIFETVSFNHTDYLIPIIESEELIIENQSGNNILVSYHKGNLIQALRKYTKESNYWNQINTLSEFTTEELRGISSAPPTHCSFLTPGGSGKVGFRWTNFGTTAVDIRYSSTLDQYFSGCNTQATNAINDLKINYTGTNLLNGSTHGYVPNCSQGSAASGNFIPFINSTYGSSRNILIMYNDPCNEIPDLVNCFGILAIGGLYGSSCNLHDGVNWYNGAYGYVIVNDTAGACLGSTSYKLMLTHELTHSLGVGHISSSFGNANMNPSCCKTISSLDIACLDYLYNPSPTPVVLMYFDAIAKQKKIELTWATASESSNDYFEIERSTDRSEFYPIAKIKGLGASIKETKYSANDELLNYPYIYYRLKQVDYNGTYEYSSIKTVENKSYRSETQLRVYLDQKTNKITFFNLEKSNEPMEFHLFDVVGKSIFTSSIKVEPTIRNQSIQLNNKLRPGNYYINLNNSLSNYYGKIVVN